MTEPKFTPGRDQLTGYQTRDGRPVRVLCTDAAGAYPIRGLVPNGDEESSTSWDADGCYISPDKMQSLDLIDRPEPKKTVWVNWYDEGHMLGVWPTREDADRSKGRQRFACTELEIPEPGTGLEP